MIRHIVMWNLQAEFSPKEKHTNAQLIKEQIEALKGVIPCIVELKILVNALPSSNRAIMMDSLFESAEALASYQAHPEHLRVIALVGSMLCDRTCMDYLE